MTSQNCAPSGVAAKIPWREMPALVLILILAAILYLASPPFRTSGNLLALTREISVIGVMACGEAVVLIIGGIDLSVASTLVLATGGAALAMMAGWPILVAVALGIGIGLVAGVLNGWLISALRLPAIVVTLATYGLYRALITLLSHSREIGPLPPAFAVVGFGVAPLSMLAGVAAILSLLMVRTPLGRRLYALGGNEEACRVSGIFVGKLKPAAYALSGGCAALAGFLVAASSGSVQSKAAMGYELDVIAACVIGGVSIRGGQGSILGAIAGAVLLRLLNNALLLLNVPVDWYRMVIALVLLAAAIGDRFAVRRTEATA